MDVRMSQATRCWFNVRMRNTALGLAVIWGWVRVQIDDDMPLGEWEVSK